MASFRKSRRHEFDAAHTSVDGSPLIAGGIDLEVRALDWRFDTWLPRSGFEPDNQPAFEAWIGRPFAHGSEHFEIACQLPVRPV